MAILRPTIELDIDYSKPHQEWQAQERRFIETVQKTLRSENEGDLVGEVVRWPRADGYACYMVVSQEPLELAHIAVGDGWRIDGYMIRGLIVDDIELMVKRERAIRELFKS